ncbi:SRPBCC family protein [Cryptosporangium arvum]|uniref:Polyketide cyclase/dehydrase and lipid transport protein n=1 Tax=Cryptosporangium arvum DSM 44712 TaxID=927661 RepID=A0A011AEQ6_9ACTN|nr:SRPBCC family protein [Cryptosporangium arvum]EXG80521.1 polyketide cyclase/dehydrase and lipid transport protein [Cryptosporangium arvum DSM 44712]
MTWSHRHSELTTATPAQLWTRWTTAGSWRIDDPGVEWARFDGAVVEGATGVVKTHGAPARTIEFTRVEPGRAMDFTIRLPLATLAITHDMEPAAGGTRTTHGVVLDGPLHRVYALLLGGTLARGLPTVVRNVTAGALRDGDA